MLLKLPASSLQTESSLASVSLKSPQHSYERLPGLPKRPSLRKKAAIEQHNAVKNDDRNCDRPVCSSSSVVEFAERMRRPPLAVVETAQQRGRTGFSSPKLGSRPNSRVSVE